MPGRCLRTAYGYGAWNDQTADIPTVVPDPQVRMKLSSPVHAVKLDVTYPDGVIDVLDAIQASTAADNDLIDKRATVWFDDDGNGSVTIQAAANGQEINAISLVFGLDASQPLEGPDYVVASVSAAYDEDGNSLSNITVVEQEVR